MTEKLWRSCVTGEVVAWRVTHPRCPKPGWLDAAREPAPSLNEVKQQDADLTLELAYAAPQASEAADTLTIDLDYADGASVQIEVHGTERMLRRLEAWLGGERSRIREQSRNAALEEAAGLVGGCTWAGSSKMVSALIAEHIRALKQPQADKDCGQHRAEDAERWHWATATDENAQMLYTIVQAYGGDQQKINERADFYRAALSATQTEQGERD